MADILADPYAVVTFFRDCVVIGLLLGFVVAVID